MIMRVLITVKAYPAISTKYGETVCTAGITEDGKWIRIYPIPFRKLDYYDQFKKYDWIEIDLVRNTTDFRHESYRPVKLENIKKVGHLGADGGAWLVRREVVLNNVYTSLDKLISEAKTKNIGTSLATFKPTEIKDFIYKPVSGNWDKKKLQKIKLQNAQASLFENDDENDIKNFEVVDKIPYKFSFVFEDDSGRESTMMIEDWETGMLYWNSLIRHNGDEKKACEDVRKKYWDDFAKTKDYYFFLGTTKNFHNIAPNPFVIIGDFRPKHITQESLLFFDKDIQDYEKDLEYRQFLEDIKNNIKSSQVRATVKSNSELILLYWNLGKSIIDKQSKSSWGDGLIKQLSKDLANEFPNLKGFSQRNLSYIKQWYSYYSDNMSILQQPVAELTPSIIKNLLEIFNQEKLIDDGEINLQQPVAELDQANIEFVLIKLLSLVPWGHHIHLMTKCKDINQSLFYILKTIENGWSRSVLVHQIESSLYDRQGKAINNFNLTLPKNQSDLANELLKDPYIFDFLSLSERASERDIENQLTSHITKFLLELGKGFAFVGKQYHLQVSDKDYYIDLLFFNFQLKTFFVIELKAVDFEPEFVGKLGFYLSSVDKIHKPDNPSIGLILCKTKDKVIAEYALQNQKRPIGVAEYQIVKSIPKKLKSTLPTIEEFEKLFEEKEH